MRIIGRYILRAHIAPFLFGVVLVVFLYIFQFILKYIDQLLGKGIDPWVIIQLIALNTAWMVVMAVPLGVLFSTVMAFGSMAAAHEITIIKSSGGSLLRMMVPVLIAGVILTFFLFWFNDEVLPEANHRAKVLMGDIKRTKPTFSIESGKFSTELEGYTILARSVDSLSGTLYGVTIYDNTKVQGLNIVSADTGKVKFTPDMARLILTLYNGEAHQMIYNDVKNYRIVDFQEYRIIIKAEGFAFTQSDASIDEPRGDREMHIVDMREISDGARAGSEKTDQKIKANFNEHLLYLMAQGRNSEIINRVGIQNDESMYTALKGVRKRLSYLISSISADIMRKDDYDSRADKYEVEIYKKYAIPFACFIFIFVGCPLGIITKGGNFGFSAAITLAFYIFYWACLIGGEKLADRGFMTPFMSMWLGNILVGIMGVILTIKINNESFTFPGKKLFVRIFRRLEKIN